jgi:hypothetical protein
MHAITDAVDVLGDLPAWRLAPGRWEQVEQTLDALGAAIGAGDLHAVESAVAVLEVLGPTRITRIGANPTMPVPAPIRERTQTLVHLLSGFTAATAGGRDPGGDDRPATR